VVFGIAIGVLVIVLVVLIAFMATPSQPKLRVGQSPRDHGAEAWIEDHDIDEMIEARNERRQRLGWPAIGDELELEVRRAPGGTSPDA
jgi:hypothetical protein